MKNIRSSLATPKAGTGKSTLIRFIVEALPGISEDDVVYCAYTGKATQVLSKKGNKNVRSNLVDGIAWDA